MRETLALLAIAVALTVYTIRPLLSHTEDPACSGTTGVIDRELGSLVFLALDDGGSALVARTRLRAEAAEGMVVDRCFFTLPEETATRIAAIHARREALAALPSRAAILPIPKALADAGWASSETRIAAAAAVDRPW